MFKFIKFANEYGDVRDFHMKFDVPTDACIPIPYIPEPNVTDYRAKFLQEELDEYIKACSEGDLNGALDALIDLVYVAKGTALMHGVSPALWKELWEDVQRANMTKERATSAEDSRSKRGHSLDVVKPEGWVGPDGTAILRKHGADV